MGSPLDLNAVERSTAPESPRTRIGWARLAGVDHPTRTRRWSLKARLGAIVVLFMSVSLIAHGVLRFAELPDRANAEIEGTASWVLALLPDRLPTGTSATQGLEQLAQLVRGLENVRHIRVTLHAADGRQLAAAPTTPAALPSFIARWLDKPQPALRKEIVENGRTIGYFELVPAAADELAELWEDQVSNSLLMIGLSLVAMALILTSAFRVLAPLDQLRQALQKLGEGRRPERLPLARNPEFDDLAQAFNRMSDALEQAQSQRQALMRKLVDNEESTRKTVAHDLHDEIAPYLVALQPIARTLELQCAGNGQLAETAGLLLSHQSRMLVAIRNTIQGLRPPELDTLGLRESLGRLASSVAGSGPDRGPVVRLHPGGLWDGFGPTLDASIYRMVRECVANACRHARPSRIDILFEPDSTMGDARPALRIRITNDGVTHQHSSRTGGLGTLGMQERCVALGGEFSAGPLAGGHWCVTLLLPLDGMELWQ